MALRPSSSTDMFLLRRKLINTYYRLVKPGIVYGNALTAAAGFYIAVQGPIPLSLLLATLAGLSLVIGSACVCNNYLDRDIDALMERTKDRALARGLVPPSHALFFASFLALTGVALLFVYTDLLTAALTILLFLVYVFWYTPAKRRSVYATYVGAIAGALPPVVGYTAVSNTLDSGALLLFVILFFWQMPHFFAIAIFRLKEYATADIPIWPIRFGIHSTKILMMLFTAAFATAVFKLFAFGYVGLVYLYIVVPLSMLWLGWSVYGFLAENDERWARRMFYLSLLVIMSWCVAIFLR